MRKIAPIILFALALLTICLPASAASKLSKYALVADGEQIALSSKTGYLMRSGDVMMIPVEKICDAMSLPYSINKNRTSMIITREDGKKVEIRTNTKTIAVDGKKQTLKVKTEHQTGKLFSSDVNLLKALNLSFKHHKASATTKALGYKDGALVVAEKGGDTSPPSLVPASVLPEAAKEAAKTANQIVMIKYQSGSTAKMTYYEKRSGNVWNEVLSSTAYVGKKGVGKTKEGDQKTPLGTYNLTKPFGIKADPGTTLGDYLKVTKYHYWSGQNGSYYNRLIDTRVQTKYKPNSKDEHLIDYKGVYNYAVFIDYNASGKDSKGSAIFLHCTGSNKYTGGCVAIPEATLKTLLCTLRSGAKIVIYS